MGKYLQGVLDGGICEVCTEVFVGRFCNQLFPASEVGLYILDHKIVPSSMMSALSRLVTYGDCINEYI